ncbi:MAG TPA: hypothetical protein VIJ51_12745 [Solirubrobacteraceae bacterium]
MAPTTPSAPSSGSSSTSAKKPSTTTRSSAAKPRTPRAKPRTPRATPAASREPSKRVARETTTAKSNATRAGNARAKAAKATKTELKSSVKLVETYAERAVLVPVGAALAAREAIGDLIGTYSSPKKAEAQLKRFEHRGVKARTKVEREATKARKRVEDALHKRRTDVEKAVSKFDRRRHAVEKRVTDQVGDVTAKIDDTVRQAADAGQGIVDKARETVDSII